MAHSAPYTTTKSNKMIEAILAEDFVRCQNCEDLIEEGDIYYHDPEEELDYCYMCYNLFQEEYWNDISEGMDYIGY